MLGPAGPEEAEGWLKHLPAEVVALIAPLFPITDPTKGLQARNEMTQALAEAKGSIKSIPRDKNVRYQSKRTQEWVDYDFASLHAVHEGIDEILSSHGLTLNCLMNPQVVVLVMQHTAGGMMISWLDLAPFSDVKDVAAQVSMIRRYLTVQMLCLAAEEEAGERDIPDNAREENAKRLQRQREESSQRQQARPQSAGRRAEQGRQAQRQAREQRRDETANRIDAGLAKLPADVANQLRAEHRAGGPEMLKAVEAALAQKQAKESMTSGGGQTNGGASPDNISVEERLRTGFARLGMNETDEQALRQEFKGKPDAELLAHVRALYRKTLDQQGPEQGQQEGQAQQ